MVMARVGHAQAMMLLLFHRSPKGLTKVTVRLQLCDVVSDCLMILQTAIMSVRLQKSIVVLLTNGVACQNHCAYARPSHIVSKHSKPRYAWCVRVIVRKGSRRSLPLLLASRDPRFPLSLAFSAALRNTYLKPRVKVE